jgi:hypothetical protein
VYLLVALQMLHVGDMAHVELPLAILLQQLGHEQVPEPIGQLPRLKRCRLSRDRDPDCWRTVRHRFRLGIECV